LCLSVLWFSCEDTPTQVGDSDSPVVDITYPISNSELTETTFIRAEVSDDSSIIKVIFFINGLSVFEDTESPYEYEWDICLENVDNHTILVKAEDEFENQGQSSTMIVSTNGVYDCYSVCGGGIFDDDEDGICNDVDDCEGDGIDEDNDGICDNIDDCVGMYDECGVCNGDGVDADEDGICDDVDDCIGFYDCLYECNGNAVIDECGVCNGDGIDADEDGICDDVDDCVGIYDECGVCNGENDDLDDCDVCNGDGTYCLPINLSFGNITHHWPNGCCDSWGPNDGYELEVIIDSPQNISEFLLTLTENDAITAASGGLAEEYGFNLIIDPINVGDYNMLYGSSSNDDLLPSYINGILTNLIVVPINHDYDAQICFEGGNTIFTKTVNPNSEIDLIHDEEDGDLDGIINYQINFGECIPLPPSPF